MRVEDVFPAGTADVGVLWRQFLREGRQAGFDPFQRATSGYTRRAGLGLGLFITKSIVDAHGGTVEVRSDDSETAFIVVLPRR